VCGLVSIAVSSFRYQSKRSDQRLRERLVELAREKPRYGYRRLQVLMQRDGERVNHKRLYRVYREAGLACGGRSGSTACAAEYRSARRLRPTRSGRLILRMT
jgi:putative transposase